MRRCDCPVFVGYLYNVVVNIAGLLQVVVACGHAALLQCYLYNNVTSQSILFLQQTRLGPPLWSKQCVSSIFFCELIVLYL
jgi:hypothetical protein